MFKPLTLIACLVSVLFCNTSFAQKNIIMVDKEKAMKKDTKLIAIRSLDGRDVKVRVIPDYINYALKVVYLKDTISVGDWGTAPDIAVLNNQFIKLEYPLRAGSNEGHKDMLMVCVNHNRLYEAMHIVENTNYDTEDDRELYDIKTTISGSDKKNYQVNVNIHDDAHNKENPDATYIYNSKSVLHFDTTRNAFYSIKTGLWDTYTIHPNKGKKFKKNIRGNFLVIFLGKYQYYFIYGRWYELETTNAFDEL